MGIERLILLASLLAACDGDVSVEGGGGAGSGGAPGAGGESPIAAGGSGGGPECPESGGCVMESNCLVTGDDGGCRVFACDLPEPCEEIEFSSEEAWGLMGPYTLENPGALACVLEALSAGTEGTYRWRSRGSSGSSGYGVFNVVHVNGGRIAVGIRDSAGDLGTIRGTIGPVELREPSYFDGCAALSSGDAIWGCLEGWSLGCPGR